MPRQYKHLTAADRAHFLEHGWLRVENAVAPQYLKEWLECLWVRLGWDKNDPSTWTEEYVKLPAHREVPAEQLIPAAWGKICELVGGEDKIDPVRERYLGDKFICNFGKEEHVGKSHSYDELDAWHTDNDWYRQFLDSGDNALTVICCFTDILPQGGGTAICEDGLKHVAEYFYQHPEGCDPPYSHIFEVCKNAKEYREVVAKAGDVFITHGMLPHTHTPNHLRYARVITNPHVNLHSPINLDRRDGDYTLCEQVILNALGRTSIPPSDYSPTRERLSFYPRVSSFRKEMVEMEIQRMIQDAQARGLPTASVDSLYLRGAEAIAEHERRNGFDKAWHPLPPNAGVIPGNVKVL